QLGDLALDGPATLGDHRDGVAFLGLGGTLRLVFFLGLSAGRLVLLFRLAGFGLCDGLCTVVGALDDFLAVVDGDELLGDFLDLAGDDLAARGLQHHGITHHGLVAGGLLRLLFVGIGTAARAALGLRRFVVGHLGQLVGLLVLGFCGVVEPV